jgi:hypothetical protein
MSSPEFHGEKITNPAEKAKVDNAISEIESLLDGSAAARLAAQFAPVVPDGGEVGRRMAPRLSRAARIRDGLRIWAPGIGATGAWITTVTVFDVPGPLAVYGLGIAGFGWWHSAGRPGPIDSARMVAYATTDHYARLRARVERLSQRRSTYEARRTSTDTGSQ